MMLKKKGFRILLIIILPFIMTVFSILTLFDKGLVIFPDPKVSVTTYSDSLSGGASQIQQFSKNEGTVRFSYILRKKTEYPFAGIIFEVGRGGKYLDISPYRYMTINVGSSASKNLRIYLLTNEEGITNAFNPASYRYLETKLIISDPGVNSYTIDLSRLDTLAWWYTANNVSETEVGKPNMHQLIRIQVENGLLLPVGVKDDIVIESLAFKRSYLWLYIATGFIALLALAVIITGILLKPNNQTIITYKPLTMETNVDNDTRKVVEYITSHYANPDLSIESIASATGILPSKISHEIKEYSKLTFKQFLNNIRLTEAKRLLEETDNQVIEISYNVGYNSVSHFNRLFKKIEDISPSEYRKLRKK